MCKAGHTPALPAALSPPEATTPFLLIRPRSLEASWARVLLPQFYVLKWTPSFTPQAQPPPSHGLPSAVASQPPSCPRSLQYLLTPAAKRILSKQNQTIPRLCSEPPMIPISLCRKPYRALLGLNPTDPPPLPANTFPRLPLLQPHRPALCSSNMLDTHPAGGAGGPAASSATHPPRSPSARALTSCTSPFTCVPSSGFVFCCSPDHHLKYIFIVSLFIVCLSPPPEAPDCGTVLFAAVSPVPGRLPGT